MILHAVQPTDTAHYIGGVFSLQGHDGAIARFRVYFDKRNHRLLVRSASYHEQPYHGIQEISADPNGSPLFDAHPMTDYAELGPNTAPVDPVRTRTEEQLRQVGVGVLPIPSQWTTTSTPTPTYLIDPEQWRVEYRTATEATVNDQRQRRAEYEEAQRRASLDLATPEEWDRASRRVRERERERERERQRALTNEAGVAIGGV